jgi:hypothetical protein
MALVLADRVQETSTTTGTGTLTLAGAVVGYRSFATIGNGNTTYYTITNTAGAWEVGIGTYTTAGTTLSRTTVLSSSNAGALVSFTGTLNVFVTYPASKSVNLDASNNLTVLNTTYLGGASGNQSLQVSNVVSGVNYLAMSGNTTGSSPVIYAAGVDANVSVTYSSKGANGHYFQTNSFVSNQFAVTHTASAVNYLQTTGGAAGSWPITSSQGSDTNIGMVFVSKGTGGFTFSSAAGAAWFYVNQAASAVNYLSVAGAATGSAPNLQALGTDTNVAMTFSTKGTFGYGFYTNSFAQQQFVIAHTASAVNYLQAAGGATTIGPTLTAQGSDTNIYMVYSTKGSGSHLFSTNNLSSTQFAVAHTASAVNYLQATGNVTGGNPVLLATGSDANVGLALSSKGVSGNLFYTNAGANLQFVVAHTASAVNYLQVTGAVTGSGVVVSAQGSDTNIDAVITPKGTGATYSPNFAASNGLVMNNATINTSYTLPTGYNAVSAGPVTVASGVTVTVPSGSVWVVV